MFRLLAWTVADARGATVPLDKALALTVGRRLISRADTVRGELAAAAAQAEEARAGALGDGELAAIDETEQAAIRKARDEVYIGFWELDELLPGAPDRDAAAMIRYPKLNQPRDHTPLPPISGGLAAALGAGSCAELQARYGDRACEGATDAEAWLPFVFEFMNELRAMRRGARNRSGWQLLLKNKRASP